jgi:hypothetical protein
MPTYVCVCERVCSSVRVRDQHVYLALPPSQISWFIPSKITSYSALVVTSWKKKIIIFWNGLLRSTWNQASVRPYHELVVGRGRRRWRALCGLYGISGKTGFVQRTARSTQSDGINIQCCCCCMLFYYGNDTQHVYDEFNNRMPWYICPFCTGGSGSGAEKEEKSAGRCRRSCRSSEPWRSLSSQLAETRGSPTPSWRSRTLQSKPFALFL